MSKTSLQGMFQNGINQGTIIPYAHKGEWAVHELLPIFYKHIGPFNLRLATFNISEDALRPIYFMLEREEILSVNFLFDRNVQRHKLDILLFAEGMSKNIRVSSTHMKVLLAHNDKYTIAVVGSANMNRNVRHEAGFIVTDSSYHFFSNYFDDVFKNEAIQVYGSD